eukprot:gene12131-25462_t
MKWVTLLVIFSINESFVIIKQCLKPNVKPTFAFPTKSSGAKGPVETFFCEECGAEHIKWVGRCAACKEWNTVKAFRVASKSRSVDTLPPLDKRSSSKGWLPTISSGDSPMVLMSSINLTMNTQRLNCWSTEVNRVLGGGLVRGSVILLAGEPGIGKSTLLLQLVSSLAKSATESVLYVSGEETAEQIVSRAQRLQLSSDGVYILCEVDADTI